MSRIYLTYSRLQGACDAGALIGRKTIGVGTWDANDSVAGDKALKIFNQNFVSGAYGSREPISIQTIICKWFLSHDRPHDQPSGINGRAGKTRLDRPAWQTRYL